MANPTSYYHGHKWQITELGLVPAPPKLGRSRNVLPVGGQCNDLCKVFPKGLSNSQGTNPYDTHAYCKRCERYIPKIDFSEPQNFAKFGSAKEYYSNSIKYIYNSYPYDGSLKEKAIWR